MGFRVACGVATQPFFLMVALPTSIEAALQDAGFTTTEILVLRKLMEEEGLTLRELASKTGKSTGVLDQASKKLVRKGIIHRQDFNGVTKFVLHSISAISDWMARDMREKREMLSRRFENFESFIATVELDKKRPEMEFFDGEEGIKKAYNKLLSFGRKELLHYTPVLWTAEEDPLRDFRVQFFRERRSKGVFSRVIAHNTPLGRRYVSRDPFEYRKTLLVEESEHPFAFEKIIVNGVVACINLQEQRACFIRFPEFAESERMIFESLWALETAKQKGAATPDPIPSKDAEQRVSISTKTFSAFREFFLSKKSLVTFAIFGVVAALITGGLYMRTSQLNLQRMKDQVKAIASTAAFQFDARDLDKLRVESDWKRPEWAKVVNQLREIRQSNEDIKFAYIFRKSFTDPKKIEFVADSHSINPFVNSDSDPSNDIDFSGDGKIDEADELSWPGQEYKDATPVIFEAFNGPVTDDSAFTDQWGTVIAGHAPIKNAKGEAVAVVGIDMEYSQLAKFNAQTFTPILYFLGFFLLFIFIRLFAFNRSLFKELWGVCRMVKVRWYVPVILVSLVLFGWGVHYMLRQNAIRTVGLRMQSIAATAASDFSDLDLNSLRKAEDMKTETYQKAFKLLNEIRNKNMGVKWAYIFRYRPEINLLEFIADADSNYFLPDHQEYNFDGKIDDADENVFPGFALDDLQLTPIVMNVIKTGMASYEPNIDQWGSWISGFAPIYNKNGDIIGILGVDFDINQLGLNNF